jgi:hypothetical protein
MGPARLKGMLIFRLLFPPLLMLPPLLPLPPLVSRTRSRTWTRLPCQQMMETLWSSDLLLPLQPPSKRRKLSSQ